MPLISSGNPVDGILEGLDAELACAVRMAEEGACSDFDRERARLSSFVDSVRRIGPDSAVVVTTVDGCRTCGRLVAVGADMISLEETLGTGPVRIRRVIARHAIRIDAVSRVAVAADEA